MILRTSTIAMLLVLVGGCCNNPQTPPKASIGDVAVFSSLHLLAAEAGTEVEGSNGSLNVFNGPFTSAQLKRHFETKSTDYPNLKAHADDLLDGVQGQSAFFQAAQNQFAASLAATFAAPTTAPAGSNPTPPPSPGSPPAPAPGTANTTGLEADAKTAFAGLLSSTPNDSPFDQLDRVADFYAGYVIKNLRVRTDSRVILPSVLANMVVDALPDAKSRDTATNLIQDITKDSANSALDGDRMILLVFQAEIDAGNQPDKWVGVRLKVTNPVPARKAPDAVISTSDIRVIRVHPTHTYDVDLQTFGSTTSSALALAAQASGSYAGIGASGSAAESASQEASERQRYLSRTSKITSFADAPSHMFGFNFYPSNVKVVKSTGLFGGTTYKAEGYIEGGARDCAAMLIVPRSLGSLDLQVSYVTGDINTGEEKDVATPPDNIVHVTLPEWNALELVAATVGAGPTSFAAQAVSAPPPVQPAPASPAPAATAPTTQPGK